MRILLLVERLTVGGLPNYVLELARALQQAGDTVALAHDGAPVPSHLDLAGVELLALGEGGHVDAGEATRRLRAWRPELLHLHLCSHLALLQALPGLGVPLLRSFHDYTSVCLRRGRRRWPGDRCPRALGWSCSLQGCLVGPPAPGGRMPRLMDLHGKLAERDAYRGFDTLVVGSQHMRRVLLVNGFEAGRIAVLPYFSRFDRQARDERDLPPRADGVPGRDRPLELLFAGQAVTGKGLEVLVRALADVRGDWKLTAVSAGPRLPAARAEAARLGLQERVRFLDWMPQEALVDLYRGADLFVLPSVWDDPGPLVGIEAMSFGTPVLAFPVGGIPDYVLDDCTGYLAAQVTPRSLSQALQRAFDEAHRLGDLGRAGRDLVARVHHRAVHVQALQTIYREAAGHERAQRHRPSIRIAENLT